MWVWITSSPHINANSLWTRQNSSVRLTTKRWFLTCGIYFSPNSDCTMFIPYVATRSPPNVPGSKLWLALFALFVDSDWSTWPTPMSSEENADADDGGPNPVKLYALVILLFTPKSAHLILDHCLVHCIDIRYFTFHMSNRPLFETLHSI